VTYDKKLSRNTVSRCTMGRWRIVNIPAWIICGRWYRPLDDFEWRSTCHQAWLWIERSTRRKSRGEDRNDPAGLRYHARIRTTAFSDILRCISIIIGCSLSVPAGWRSPIYDFIAVCAARRECVDQVREHEPDARPLSFLVFFRWAISASLA